jgi:hypothetical protein
MYPLSAALKKYDYYQVNKGGNEKKSLFFFMTEEEQ